MKARLLPTLVALAVLAGCALYSDVVIGPLIYDPANIERGGDLPSMLRKFDYNTAISLAKDIELRPRKSAQELGALGEAEFIAGRYDDARRHLRQAIDLQPFRTTYAQIAWDLSQLEYMTNNFEASLDWARIASDHGIIVKSWHMAFLESLANVNTYRFQGATSDRVPMRIGHPDVPRVDVIIDGKKQVSAIVDSGAVTSIISQSLAASLPVHSLGTFEGTFNGLLGEPIPVHFGLLETLDIGRMRIENVPVAIMPDDKMKFLVSGRKEFKIDFLLGAHLLKEFRIEMDFRRDNVYFSRVPQALRRPAADQNLFIEQFRPAVRATVNRHGWFMFILDTGSEVTFLNEGRLGDMRIQIFTPKMHNATLQGLGGAKKHGEKLEDIEVGVDRWAGTFKTIPMYDAGEHERTTGIVGENYLKNFDVVIDFGRMRVDLAPIGVLSVMTVDSSSIPTDQRTPPP
ncbi:MAG TPA: aspartyl protease family protein [Thermoanaerobaculia bacterium]|nr:aspartyl protease family protein [Thermoanaerobaculia bacterium]